MLKYVPSFGVDLVEFFVHAFDDSFGHETGLSIGGGTFPWVSLCWGGKW